MAAELPRPSCFFEVLFRSAYFGRPVLSFLTEHDHGSLYFASSFIRRLLILERVKIPQGCVALCGVDVYARETDNDSFNARKRDLKRALVQSHVGVLRAMWETCSRHPKATESALCFVLYDEMAACLDDDCIAYAVLNMRIAVPHRAVSAWLDTGKRALLMGLLAPASEHSSSSGIDVNNFPRTLTLVGIERGDTALAKYAALAVRTGEAGRATADWMFVNSAVRRAVGMGNVEVLELMVDQRNFCLEDWSELVTIAIHKTHLPMVEFLFARRGQQDKISEEARRAAIINGSDRILDLVYMGAK